MAKTPVPALWRRIARQILLEWRASKTPIDKLVRQSFTEARVGQSERQAIGDVIFMAIRYWPLIASESFNPEIPKQLREFEDSVLELFSSDPAKLDRKHSAAKPKFEDSSVEHLRKFHHVPNFMLEEFGGKLEILHEYLHAMLAQAPTILRVNRSRISRDDFILRFADLPVVPSPWLPDALYLSKRIHAQNHEAFLEGFCEIQDEHSQLASIALDIKPGMRVLDLCAGGGGKSLHLAALLGNSGRVDAFDVDSKKLNRLSERARRAGFTNIKPLKTAPKGAHYDRVLLDVPCSGLGTLRRSPDRLVRFSHAEARELRNIQRDLLAQGSSLLAPNGKLVYATCTMRPAENMEPINEVFPGYSQSAPSIVETLRPHLGAATDNFLTLAAASPAARLASMALPANALQMGPWGQTSGALVGDAFFICLVK